MEQSDQEVGGMNTVLLIEDNSDNQTVIEDIFEFDDIGAELVVADDAESALDQIEEIRPILILMDIGLPGMSGLEATKKLKEDPQTRNIPIWAITAHGKPEDYVKAIGAGCDDYTTKPIDSRELTHRLREFMNRSGASNAACWGGGPWTLFCSQVFSQSQRVGIE